MNRASDLIFILGAGIGGLPAATAAGQPIIWEQLQALLEGNDWKNDVRVAAPVNVNLAAPGATIDGVTMALNDRFLAPNQTTNTENGYYVYNGAAVAATRAPDGNTGAELVNAFVPVAEGTSAGVVYRQTAINITLGTTSIGFTTAFNSAPPASTSTAGIAAFATQVETDAGVVTNKTITPALLASWSGRKRKLEGTLGDGTATSFSITHGFNNRGVEHEVYRNSTPWDTIGCDVERPDANTIVFKFKSAPSTAMFAYVLLG